MTTFRNIPPRMTAEQILARSAALGDARARARRERWTGFAIMVGAFLLLLLISVWAVMR